MASLRFFPVTDGLDGGERFHLWKFNVHEDQIKTQSSKLGQRLPPAAGEDYLMT